MVSSPPQDDSVNHLLRELAGPLGQQHLFPSLRDAVAHFAPSDDDGVCGADLLSLLSPHERQRLDELASFERSYPGGITSYLASAQRLLSQAQCAESLEFAAVQQPPIIVRPPSLLSPSEELYALEGAGVTLLPHTAFVLVAGGLGERLGFSGIKTGLPVETASGTTFLEHFLINFINDVHRQRSSIPMMMIMTSSDTHDRTITLLESIAASAALGRGAVAPFELGVDVVCVQQETVFCLADNTARIAVDAETGHLLRKPHGHGDVHALLNMATVLVDETTGRCCPSFPRGADGNTQPPCGGGVTTRRRLVEMWQQAGVKYVCFCQDTNATSTWTVPVSLALCEAHRLDMAFTCVPRIPKEAVGLLCHVQPSTTSPPSSSSLSSPHPFRTVNVEYNRFDPIYRALYGTGDVSSTDPNTAPYSPFPGSINTLLLRLEPYAEILRQTRGTVPEFINPKYKDPIERADFKAPTRVESLMQDVALLFDPELHRVGGIVFERVLYHPVKNSASEALGKIAIGGDAHCAATGEENMFVLMRERLRRLGACVESCFAEPTPPCTPLIECTMSIGDATNGTADESHFTVTSCLSQPGTSSPTGTGIKQQRTAPIVVGEAKVIGDSGESRSLTVQLLPMIACVGAGVYGHCTLSSLRRLFPHPDRVRITGRSTIVIVWPIADDLVIESLDLDGALTIVFDKNSTAPLCAGPPRSCRVSSLRVRNRGWSVVPLAEVPSQLEVDQMRGYRVVPIETHTLTVARRSGGGGDLAASVEASVCPLAKI